MYSYHDLLIENIKSNQLNKLFKKMVNNRQEKGSSRTLLDRETNDQAKRINSNTNYQHKNKLRELVKFSFNF